ncbi:spirocyclase AveC family protein [Streptomyces luteireticuli]|uniref:Spirocyclase, AveC family n=1 Tax=Streptomyces luteireticuli TaxID=173858 RepID=A0ABN0Z026_9ACTN
MAATLATFGVLIWRDCRRQGAVTLSAALFVGWLLCFWQDPLLNYRHLMVITSRHDLNVTSWGPYLPGWHPPHPELASEALVGASMFAYAAMIIWYWVPMWLTKPVLRRRPRWGLLRLLPVVLLAGAVADAVCEGLWLRTGVYMYPTDAASLSLFGGHWYQLYIPQITNIAMFISAPPVLMHLYAQRHATTVHIFRGTEQAGPRTAGWARLLAGVGFTNFFLLIAAFVGVGIGYLFGTGPIPPDTPSHLWPLPH